MPASKCLLFCFVCLSMHGRKIGQVHLYVFWKGEGSHPSNALIPATPVTPTPFSLMPWLWLGHDCSDNSKERAGEKKKKKRLPDCFSCSVMEIRFSISLHLLCFTISLPRIGLSRLLTHFLAYKCSVVLQSLVEVQLLNFTKKLHFFSSWNKSCPIVSVLSITLDVYCLDRWSIFSQNCSLLCSLS